MKRYLPVIFTATTASLLTFNVVAQENEPLKSDRPAYARDHAGRPRALRLNSAAKATEIIGMTVHNYQNEKLGSVEDLAVHTENSEEIKRAKELFTKAGAYDICVTGDASVPGGQKPAKDTDYVTRQDQGTTIVTS